MWPDVDLSQDEFAEILGARRNTVSAWGCNLIKPGATYLLRMYEEFNVNLNWLLSGEGETHRSVNK